MNIDGESLGDINHHENDHENNHENDHTYNISNIPISKIKIVNKNLERVRKMIQIEKDIDNEFRTEHSRIYYPQVSRFSRSAQSLCETIEIKGSNSVPKKVHISILKYLRNLEIKEDITVHYAVEIGNSIDLNSINNSPNKSNLFVYFVFSNKELAIGLDRVRNLVDNSQNIYRSLIDHDTSIEFEGMYLQKYTALVARSEPKASRSLMTPIIYLDRSNFRSNFLRMTNSSQNSNDNEKFN